METEWEIEIELERLKETVVGGFKCTLFTNWMALMSFIVK